jgi:LuxR family quorum sensing-dependent transcriptional regulator
MLLYVHGDVPRRERHRGCAQGCGLTCLKPIVPAIEGAVAFAEACERLDTQETVAEAFEAAVRRLGLDHYIVTGFPPPAAPLEPFVILNAWPGEWFERYDSRNYFDDDPVGQFALRQTQPFRWSEIPHYLNSQPRSVVIMEEAKAFGLFDGYCIPLHSPSGGRGAIALAACQAMDFSASERAAVHVLALTAFGRFAALRGEVAAPAPRLSRREREVLTWIAAGKSAWEVSCILSIAERTVIAHLENVRRRLDVANTLQAVVTCIRLGEIQPF